MAWEISHAPEVWDDLRAELETWDKDALIKALADDKWLLYALETTLPESLINMLIEAYVSDLEILFHDSLVDAVIERIQQTNTTENGGNWFWIDRKGLNRVHVPDPVK